MNIIDPVKEVRKAREDHAQRFGFDLNKIFEDLKKSEAHLANDGWKIVSRNPRLRKSPNS